MDSMTWYRESRAFSLPGASDRYRSVEGGNAGAGYRYGCDQNGNMSTKTINGTTTSYT